MSQAPVIAAAGAAPAEAAKGGGSNKLVLVLVALNLVAVAGVGGYVAFQLKQHPPGAASAHGAAGEGGDAGGGGEHAPAERGPIVPLESIITNMADAEETHFLKVTVQLEARDEAAQLLVEGALVPIRDRVLLRLSSLTLVETQGADKKRALQAELLTMVNDELGANRVNHVYFTEFVVQ